jgi:hypothetical protein
MLFRAVYPATEPRPNRHHPTFFEQAVHRGNLLQSSLETQRLARCPVVGLFTNHGLTLKGYGA